LRVELQETADALSSGGTAGAASGVPARKRRSIGWVVVGVTAALALAVGGAAGWMLHRPPPPFAVPKLTRATYDSGLACDPALSPDGKLLAYASDRAAKGNLDLWVQPVAGGEAVQLTHDDVDEVEPSFSPDGSQIVYRSERDGGGIYLIGALGGQPRLIAREGRTPRFSPDGTQIVYWTGKGGRTETLAWQGGRIFVVPATGGEPRQLAATIKETATPLSSPDGRQILFIGITRGPTRNYAWYVTPVVEDRPVMIKNIEVLRSTGNGTPVPTAWLTTNQIVFANGSMRGANLFRIGLDAKSAQLTGSTQQLTFGGGVADAPSVAANGLTAMADLTFNFDIWSLSTDTRTGQVKGEPERLTESLMPETQPSVSGDGRRIAYVSAQPGEVTVSLRELPNGKSTRLASFPTGSGTPFLNYDGSMFVYNRPDGDAKALFVQSTSGGVPTRVLGNTGTQTSWTSSGKIVHYQTNLRGQRFRFAFAVLDPRTRSDRPLLDDEYDPAYQMRFSHDESMITWMRLTTPQTAEILIAPTSGPWPIPRDRWIRVTDGTQWDDKPNWSPDGSMVYFTSERDGYRCLWARRIDRQSHQPTGELIPVRHFHSSRRSMSNVGLNPLEVGVGADRIVFVQGEVTGNVWLLKLP
jgi:Tol biopolymer transport system component